MGNHVEKAEHPIGVFDSGVGGISVLKELVALMPNENFIYFGDSANAPYGTKTLEQVKAFQKAKGLTVDGYVGPATRLVLLNT